MVALTKEEAEKYREKRINAAVDEINDVLDHARRGYTMNKASEWLTSKLIEK